MSAIKKLTGIGGDIRQIAALLQTKGRGGDSILAHITPREAALLRSRGGSGTINPETGLMEFYDGQDSDFGALNYEMPVADNYEAPVFEQPASFSLPAPDYSYQPISDMGTQAGMIGGAGQTEGDLSMANLPVGYNYPTLGYGQAETPVAAPVRLGAAPTGARAAPIAGGGGGADNKKSSLSDLINLGRTLKPFLPAAAATAAGAMGAQQARQAQQEAQQYRSDMQRIASPYQTQGQQMIGAAQRGELTPVNRQALEAARAQLAQQVQGRGGVGAMQATEQIARMQQTLLQNQYDYGLKLANLGDQIAIGAIKTGMQADKEMRALLQNYMTGAARIAGGSAGILGTEEKTPENQTTTVPARP